MTGLALKLGATAAAPLAKPAPLYTLTLRDKPVGYLVGEIKRRPATVQPCPVCHQNGARITEKLMLHTVRYDGVNGAASLNVSDACELDKEQIRKHPWKR